MSISFLDMKEFAHQFDTFYSTNQTAIQRITFAKAYILENALNLATAVQNEGLQVYIQGLQQNPGTTFQDVFNALTTFDLILTDNTETNYNVAELKDYIISMYFSLFPERENDIVSGTPLSEIHRRLGILLGNLRRQMSGGRSKKSKRRKKMTKRRKYKR